MVASAEKTEEKKEIRRTDEANVMGYNQFKLSVPKEIPGYKLKWVNDREGNIDMHLYNGWDFVEPEEVGMNHRQYRTVVQESTLSDKVNRVVGRENAEDGKPLRAFLMKVPVEVYSGFLKAQDSVAKAMREGTEEKYMKDNKMHAYKPTRF